MKHTRSLTIAALAATALLVTGCDAGHSHDRHVIHHTTVVHHHTVVHHYTVVKPKTRRR